MKDAYPGDRARRRGKFALGLLAFSILLAAGASVALAPRAPERKIDPGAMDRLTAAKVAFVDRDYARSDRLLHEILADRPENGEAKTFLGRVLLERGRAREAGEIFTAILKADPRNFEAARGMAAAYRGMGLLDLAIVFWTRAADLRKDDASVWKELGLAQREKGDLLGALSSIQQSLAIDPHQGDLSNLLSELATRKNDLPGGLAGPGRASRFDPLGPRPIDPESLVPHPRTPDPAQYLPRPGRAR